MPDVTSDLIADLFWMDVEAAAGPSSVMIQDPSPSVGSASVIGIGTDGFMDQVTAGVDGLTMSKAGQQNFFYLPFGSVVSDTTGRATEEDQPLDTTFDQS